MALNAIGRRNFLCRKYLVIFNRFSTLNKDVVPQKKRMEDFFFDHKVQSILKKITGVNYEKIFKPRKQKLTPYTYEFATENRLKELQQNAASKAAEKLQMPPVLSIHEENKEILAKDPELQGVLSHKIIFTDISTNVSSRDRMITVREIDGTLRKATREERFRMNQIYYPLEGRSLEVPKLFSSPHIDRLMEEGNYIFLLDIACVQFEPDDPEYHQITSVIYEHINQMKKFDVLRSTRHFGPMAFHFAYHKNIDRLIVDMLERHLISDAADAIKLLSILNPEISLAQDGGNVEIVQNFIKTIAIQKSDLELALQSFLEADAKLSQDQVSL
ncbi:28S ribosomal protein S22, mitochondrial-like [Uloborus diversus]|uniref:28S ribosomal protein S22, mitochondrial-like n=1 Tax=Uloborus diversus TaxID=327109 RepID=UPI0024096919|nr:28S ribosomal protein S22, mitochondrial-like [Uloborus diversus]